MLLLKWIKVEKPVLPSSSMRTYSSLSKKDLDNAKKEVKCALEVGENQKVVMALIMSCFVHTLAISRSPNLKFARRPIRQI